MTRGVDVKTDTRVLQVIQQADGTKKVIDEHGGQLIVDRVVFACPSNAVGNIHKQHNWYEESMLAVPEYADDHHPGTGHMHALMHNDGPIVDERYREEVIRR